MERLFKILIKKLGKNGFKLGDIKVDTRLPDEIFVYAGKKEYYLRFDIANWNKESTYNKKSISFNKSEIKGKKYYIFSICSDCEPQELIKILNGEIA